MRRRRTGRLTLALALALACGAGSNTVTGRSARGAAVSPKQTANPQVAKRFASYVSKYKNFSYAQLKKELPLKERPAVKLPFDPAKARYFDLVTRELQLTKEERDHLVKQGVVNIDHGQPYSMAAAYYAIYARDLPVLVTTDSILHALHRSYDDILKALESGLFTDTIDTVLTAVHDELEKRVRETSDPQLAKSFGDVDIYLTVARNLLAGAGVPQDQGAIQESLREKSVSGLVLSSKTGKDGEVRTLIDHIASLKMQTPENPTAIYGGKRPIDYSQLRPRGHYTESIPLKRYFRTLMWLGRADTGFIVAPPEARSGLRSNAERERRDAALLTHLLSTTKMRPRLRAMSDIIDFMVGGSDNLGPDELATRLASDGLDKIAALANDKRLAAVFEKTASGAQQIRSQVLDSNAHDPVKTKPPTLFQLFGQRFLLDSFVLSQVVFDSIVFENKKQPRMMPSGLDVMAALGNDEAVRLLEPALERYKYSANLLASRRVADDYSSEAWRSNLYNVWLDALRTLDDVPANPTHFPHVMRSMPWARKQLQTQLASWAELRHDTLLYAKQSYSAYPLCEYPEGYVEPYPDFFGKLKAFAQEAARRLGTADVSHPDKTRSQQLAATRDRQVQFFRHFESVMAWLQKIAEKELAAAPFSTDEVAFLKKTIDIRGGGSGPPRYDGWYPKLLYGGDPTKYKPSVADVHTDPSSASALEVATGSTNFLVVAIDNQNDHAVYVGPAYSYYEFTVPVSQRLTDEEWMKRLESAASPARPKWTSVFVSAANKRTLGPAKQKSDPASRSRSERDCGCPPGDKACPCF